MAGQLGRPREFDEDDVLTDIMSLFWKNGYEGTGLSEIIKATGLQKGSLYKAFENKQDMYVKALAHYEKNVVDKAVKSLVSGGAPPYERVKAFLSAPIKASFNDSDRRGCFLCNASADFAEGALRSPIAELHPDWPSDKVEKTAQLCLSVYAGIRIISRAAVDRKHLEGGRDACMDMLL